MIRRTKFRSLKKGILLYVLGCSGHYRELRCNNFKDQRIFEIIDKPNQVQKITFLIVGNNISVIQIMQRMQLYRGQVKGREKRKYSGKLLRNYSIYRKKYIVHFVFHQLYYYGSEQYPKNKGKIFNSSNCENKLILMETRL